MLMRTLLVTCVLSVATAQLSDLGVTHATVTAPTKGVTSCEGAPQGASLKGTFYFLSKPGDAAKIVVYTPSTKSWGGIDVSPTVMKMLKGASLAAVPAAAAADPDFLVVSGGGSKNVEAYNLQTKQWKSMQDLQDSQANNCAVGCKGYWLTMTGDFTKADVTEKPANRQVYRYNLTSGQVFENNGEKQRGGAGCGCDPNTPDGDARALWAGGFSDAGLTDNVESWGVDPAFHRGGEPVYSCSEKRRDVGATVCGGLFVVAGGSSGSTFELTRRRKPIKGPIKSVDVFNASSTAGGTPLSVFQMEQGLISPRVACLEDRYAVVTGGLTATGCNNRVWVLDTKTGSFNASTLLLPTTGAVAVATDGSGTAMFFDGATGDVFTATAVNAPDPFNHRRRQPPPPSPPGPVEPKAVFDGKVRPENDGSTAAYMIPPYQSNHASTIETLSDGTLAAAWFSGAHEEANDCAIVFASMPPKSGQWGKAITVSERSGYSNQNPVLFHDTKTSMLYLFHSQAKAEAGESKSTINVITSKDKGATWSQPKVVLSEAGSFPRNRLIPGLDGTVIFPYYNAGSDNKFNANYVVIGRSNKDHALADPSDWTSTPIEGSGNLVQPTLIRHAQGQPGLKAWFRDRRAESIYTADSKDDGLTWSVPVKSPLPNPNVGIEAYPLLEPGHVVMVFNNYSSKTAGSHGRAPLTVAVSEDGGVTWPYQRDLQEYDDGEDHQSGKYEYSYPTVLQTKDGVIHIMYTYDRKTIKYRAMNESWITEKSTHQPQLVEPLR